MHTGLSCSRGVRTLRPRRTAIFLYSNILQSSRLQPASLEKKELRNEGPDWFSSLMSQDRTREPGRWEPSPAHATSQCLVGWASAARPQRDVVWLQICTHMLPPLLSVHAPRACVLASPEPGSGETSDFCVSREPGSRYLFASRETGPIAGAANQSAGACIGRAWFGAHAANQTHPNRTWI